ncbi:hypothetical protein JOD69_001156 [Methylocaldum sp. RMAD-M]|nr:hypothetical protein [Methylocaldum sp. RMAD-M]
MPVLSLVEGRFVPHGILLPLFAIGRVIRVLQSQTTWPGAPASPFPG